MFDLLGTVWKRLPSAVERARGWGADWCERSEAFVERDGEEVVAHVGVLPIPVMLDGRAQTLAGVHAVCTRADRRGRGLMRSAMERALARIDAGGATAVLWANDPAIYGRFGFVEVIEALFLGPAPPSGPARGRVLSLDRTDDLRIFRESYRTRAPVSPRLGALDDGWLTLINVALWPPPGPTIALVDDAVVSYTRHGTTLRIHDVAARELPPLRALVAALGDGADTVEVHFVPDALDARELAPKPMPGDHFMVRGPLDVETFALSPLSHC